MFWKLRLGQKSVPIIYKIGDIFKDWNNTNILASKLRFKKI